MTIIDLIKNGDATKVTDIIERALQAKAVTAINEEKMTVMAELYGEVPIEENVEYVEEAKGHTIPGLSKWNMYAGGTAGGGKHSYDFHLNDGDIDKPTSHTQYSVSPVTHSNGRFKGYHASVWSPKAGHPGHHSLGMHRNPNKGVEAAQAHHDKHFGKKQVKEEQIAETEYEHATKGKIQNPNSSGQGHDPDHSKNPYHDSILKHGYEYSHSTPVNHSSYSVGPKNPDYPKQDIRIHHTYKHKTIKDHVLGVSPTKSGSQVWQTHRLGNSPGSGTSGTGIPALEKHLKTHLARAKKKYGEKK